MLLIFHECAKLLSINGIKKVIYANEWGIKDNIDIKKISIRILDAANITFEEYTGRGRFVIDIYD